MIARPAAFIVVVALAGACGGAQDRPEPPSGAVDPGAHGLVTPVSMGETPKPPAQPGAPAPAAGGGLEGRLEAAGLPRAGLPPSAPAARPSGNEPAAEAAGKMVMTREHCETLGRKFASLALQQGGVLGELGAGSAGDHEAAGVGRTFSDRCTRDMVGQPVEVREYQCMLRAKSADDLLSCRR